MSALDTPPPYDWRTVPRAPDDLLEAQALPHWVKMVWIALRAIQGNRDATSPDTARGYVCRRAGLTNLTQVSQAVRILSALGWVEKQGPRQYRCHLGRTAPGEVEAVVRSVKRRPSRRGNEPAPLPKRAPSAPPDRAPDSHRHPQTVPLGHAKSAPSSPSPTPPHKENPHRNPQTRRTTHVREAMPGERGLDDIEGLLPADLQPLAPLIAQLLAAHEAERRAFAVRAFRLAESDGLHAEALREVEAVRSR
ncbi:MAG: hypothetical protein AAFQ53_10030, partial [Bacteroidota bacterium]